MPKKLAPPDSKLLAQKVKLSHAWDVGLVGSSTKDGGTVLVDRTAYPKIQKLDVAGTIVNALPFLIIHEKVEKQLEDLGWDYTDAHNYAEHMEEQAFKAKYPKLEIKDYRKAWEPIIVLCGKKREARPNKDMELKPYLHPHNVLQRRLLKEAA